MGHRLIPKTEILPENTMLIGMITSSTFLLEMTRMYKKEYVQSELTKIVAGWCVRHFERYKVAPKESIQLIFQREKVRKDADPDMMDLIERFLAGLSEKFANEGSFDFDYNLTEVENYLRLRSLVYLSELIKEDAANAEDIEEIEKLVKEYIPPVRIQLNCPNVLLDPAYWEDDDESANILLEYPGALGELIGPIVRGDFVTFVAPEKRGKTTYMIDLAIRGVRQGLSVLYISVGDMSEAQLKKKFRIQLNNFNPRYFDKGGILIPAADCRWNQLGECPNGSCPHSQDPILVKDTKAKAWVLSKYEDEEDHEVCTLCRRDAKKKKDFVGANWWKFMALKDVKPMKETLDFLAKINKGQGLRLMAVPSLALGPDDLDLILRNMWDREGVKPDLVLFDYFDNAKKVAFQRDFRQSENYNWQLFRGVNQKWNNALIGATQGTKETYKKNTIEQGDLSEDKRKLAHVTKAIGLNQSYQEKRNGIIRFNVIANRDDEFDLERTVTVLQSPAIGRPILDNYFTVDEKI